MQEKVFASKIFLITQRDHWVLFSVFLVILSAADIERPQFFLWGVLSIIPFIFFIIRRYISDFLFFVGGHIGLLAIMIIMPSYNIVEKVLICFMVIFYFGQSIYIKFRKSGKESNGIIPVVSVGIIAGSLFLQHFQKKYLFDNYYVVLFIVFFSLFAIQYYIDNFLKFMNVNKNSVGYIPKNEIFISGFSMSALYTVFGVIILLFSLNTKWLEHIFKLIKYVLVIILKFLLSFGKPSELEFQLDEEIIQEIPDIIPQDEATSFWLWEVIQNILMYVVLIGVIFALTISIRKLIIYLIQRFREKRNIIEKANKTVNDVRQKCEVEKKEKRTVPFWQLFTPEEKIRRIYKKRIIKEKEKIIGDLEVRKLNSYTSMECGVCIEDTDMVHLYEKARYSNYDCSKDDIRNMKKSGTDIRKSSSSYNV